MTHKLFLTITAILATFFLLSSSVYSDTEKNISLSFDKDTNSIIITVPEKTDHETPSYHLYYTYKDTIELIQGKLEEIETEIELKTCSGVDCEDHNATKVVLKKQKEESPVHSHWAIIEEGKIEIVHTENSQSIAINSHEETWLRRKTTEIPFSPTPTKPLSLEIYAPTTTPSLLESVINYSEQPGFYKPNHLPIPDYFPEVTPAGTRFNYIKRYVKKSDPDGTYLPNPVPGEAFGASVDRIGDFDGDGVEDIVVGVPQLSTINYDHEISPGALYILLLNTDGTVKDTIVISKTINGTSLPIQNGVGFGAGVASLGDLDGDGIVDLAVGAPTGDYLGSGRDDDRGGGLESDNKNDDVFPQLTATQQITGTFIFFFLPIPEV